MERLRRMGLGELRDLADHYAAICAMSCRSWPPCGPTPTMSRRLRELARRGPRRRAPEPASGALEGHFHLDLAAAAQSARLTREEMALQSEVGMLLWLAHAQAGRPGSRPTGIRSWSTASRRAMPPGLGTSAESHVEEMFSAVRALHRQVWTGRLM